MTESITQYPETWGIILALAILVPIFLGMIYEAEINPRLQKSLKNHRLDGGE